jgi:hypothetical protein
MPNVIPCNEKIVTLPPAAHVVLNALDGWDTHQFFNSRTREKSPNVPYDLYRGWFQFLRSSVRENGLTISELSTLLDTPDIERYWASKEVRKLSLEKAGKIFSRACKVGLIKSSDYLEAEQQLVTFAVQSYSWIPDRQDLSVAKGRGRKHRLHWIDKEHFCEALTARIALAISRTLEWRKVALPECNHTLLFCPRYHHNVASRIALHMTRVSFIKQRMPCEIINLLDEHKAYELNVFMELSSRGWDVNQMRAFSTNGFDALLLSLALAPVVIGPKRIESDMGGYEAKLLSCLQIKSELDAKRLKFWREKMCDI